MVVSREIYSRANCVSFIERETKVHGYNYILYWKITIRKLLFKMQGILNSYFYRIHVA